MSALELIKFLKQLESERPGFSPEFDPDPHNFGSGSGSLGKYSMTFSMSFQI